MTPQPWKTTKMVGGAGAPPTLLPGQPARLRLVPPGASRRQAVKALGVAPLGEPVLIGLSPQDARHHLHVPDRPAPARQRCYSTWPSRTRGPVAVWPCSTPRAT